MLDIKITPKEETGKRFDALVAAMPRVRASVLLARKLNAATGNNLVKALN
jgi:hypothetical protein